MPPTLKTLQQRGMNLLTKAAKGIFQSTNTAAEGMAEGLGSPTRGGLLTGEVTASCAGTYSVEVNVGQKEEVRCVLMQNSSSYYLGINDCSVPVEGSTVLVYLPYGDGSLGFILGCIPDTDMLAPGAEPQSYSQMMEVEPGGGAPEAIYVQPKVDSNISTSLNSNAGRPRDVVPGQKAWMNEQGVGLKLGTLMTTLRASDRAKIDFCLLDDTIRMTSGMFRHISSQGERSIFNDGGYLTDVSTGTHVRYERVGQFSYGPKLLENNPDRAGYNKALEDADWQFVEEPEPKNRFHNFTGYLGDMIDTYVGIPDPDENRKDPGLFHEHVDTSGHMHVRSAGGITFQRYDRISIPVKKAEPWDQEGAKLDDGQIVPYVKEPVPYTAGPYNRSLQFRDAQAYLTAQAYARIDQLSEGTNGDFVTPMEAELKVPPNKYDSLGGSTDFDIHDELLNYFSLQDDGSIVIRDAWGSEIIMSGGKIILNAGGMIEVKSGEDIVQLAGRQLIQKAKKSVDISSTEQDVRLKAQRNMHILAADKDFGGVLIESKAESDGFIYGDPDDPDSEVGEKTASTGIVLKAKDSTVFSTGKTVHMASEGAIILDGYNAEKELKGRLNISMANIEVFGKDFFTLTSGGAGSSGSQILIADSLISVAARSVTVAGGSGVSVFANKTLWVPRTQPLEGVDKSPYATQQASSIKPTYDRYVNDDLGNVLGAYTPEERDTITFTFRTTEQYETHIAGAEIGQTRQSFRIYQPAWAFMLPKNDGNSQLSGTVVAWEEEPVGETYPWPGADHYLAGDTSYHYLNSEENVVGESGYSIDRKKILDKNKLGDIKMKSFAEYEVHEP